MTAAWMPPDQLSCRFAFWRIFPEYPAAALLTSLPQYLDLPSGCLSKKALDLCGCLAGKGLRILSSIEMIVRSVKYKLHCDDALYSILDAQCSVLL